MVTESPMVRSLSEEDMDAVKARIVPFLQYVVVYGNREIVSEVHNSIHNI